MAQTALDVDDYAVFARWVFNVAPFEQRLAILPFHCPRPEDGWTLAKAKSRILKKLKRLGAVMGVGVGPDPMASPSRHGLVSGKKPAVI